MSDERVNIQIRAEVAMRVGDLAARHVGKRVTIETADATITGTLRGITVDTDWIEERRLDQHPDDGAWTPGHQTATVTIGRWTATNLPLGAMVVLG